MNETERSRTNLRAGIFAHIILAIAFVGFTALTVFVLLPNFGSGFSTVLFFVTLVISIFLLLMFFTSIGQTSVLEVSDDCLVAKSRTKSVQILITVIAIALAVLFVIMFITSDEGYTESYDHDYGSSSSNNYRSCYVCGEYTECLKYGSYYYCPTHWAYVKTVYEAQ